MEKKNRKKYKQCARNCSLSIIIVYSIIFFKCVVANLYCTYNTYGTCTGSIFFLFLSICVSKMFYLVGYCTLNTLSCFRNKTEKRSWCVQYDRTSVDIHRCMQYSTSTVEYSGSRYEVQYDAKKMVGRSNMIATKPFPVRGSLAGTNKQSIFFSNSEMNEINDFLTLFQYSGMIL